MRIKSATKRNNKVRRIEIPEYNIFFEYVKKTYKKGGLVFPSYDLYKVLKKINKMLSLLYTKTGEEYDYEPIFDSEARHNGYFDDICKKINYHITVFKDIEKNDKRVGEFLHNNRLSDKFSSLFGSIYNVFLEAMTGGDNFDNETKKQKEKIKKIVRELSYYGIDPFTPLKI